MIESQQRKETSRFYLYLTVFVAGMTTLAVEFTTSRLLQTVFGTSNIVWANVIGLVLLFLTVGYFIGGRISDKHPRYDLFYSIVTFAGFCAVFFLLLTSVALRGAATAMATVDIGAIVSSLMLVVMALAVPVTLLGIISPFAIRLGVHDVKEAGRVSGRIYAVSTWGSLLGTYLPVLLVIPEAGTRLAAVIFGSSLLIVGLGGLWQVGKRARFLGLLMPLILLPFIFLWSTGNIKDDPNQIYETESAYNYIQVIRQGDCNYLLLNEGQAYHSYYCDGGRVPRLSVWSFMLAAPFFNDGTTGYKVDNMAVIGLAAGTIPKHFTQVFGPIPIDGIELDQSIIETGIDYFNLEEPNINTIAGDGRYELNQLDKKYDIITLDAYKVPYIPWHMTTREFFREIKDRLSDDGVLAINVGRGAEDRRLVDAITATLLTVFPTVHTMDVPGSFNSILVATVLPTTSDNIYNAQTSLGEGTDPLLREVLQLAGNNLVPTTASEVIFTDQRAPVETIIDSIVIRYLLQEGPSGLPGLSG